MKFFIGRSRTFWVVHPKTGTVRKLPVTAIGLSLILLVAVSVTTFAVTLTLDRYTGGLISVADAIKLRWADHERAELLNRTKSLEATLASLQKQDEQTKKLNARVVSKLEDLQGIIGDVAPDQRVKQADKNHKSLLKPASLTAPKSVPTKTVTVLQQRRNLQKLVHILRQLKSLPLSNPVEGGLVTSRFGYRQSPFGLGTKFHQGVDISLHHTTAIRSAGDGVVKSVGTNTGYGLVIDIQHSRNVTTRYAHLAWAKVKEGQRVKTGDIIAAGGATGHATGKHLHYEVRVRGRSQNPETFMNLSRRLQLVLKGTSASDSHKG